MSPAPRPVYTQEGKNQNTNRSVLILFDQHRSKDFPMGRPWWGYSEIPSEAGAPRGIVGELSPITAPMVIDGIEIKGWDAPWVPEPKYVTLATQSITAGNRFRFDYERMIADRRTATVQYYTIAAREAAQRNLQVPALHGPISFQLRAIVGNPPKSPKLPEAALAGDPWLLGFTSKPNEVLVEILLDEQGRAAEYASQEAPRKMGSLLEQLLSLSDAERAAIAATLSGKKVA